MATAKKLPSGAYRCLIFTGKDANGKRQYKSFTADTKKEAEYLASQYLLEVEQKKKRKSERLFCDELDGYITRKEAVLSPSTIKGYKNIQRMLEKDFSNFYNKKISDMEQEDVQIVINTLSKTKSPKTIEAPAFVIDRITEVGHITTLNPHSITIMFQRVLTRHNIPHFRFHDLRHPYVTHTPKNNLCKSRNPKLSRNSDSPEFLLLCYFLFKFD